MLWLMAPLFLTADPAGIAEIARAAEGRVGAAAAIVGGKTILEYHSRESFPMQSVYKLPIGMAALAQVDHGKLKLDQMVHVEKSELVPRGLHSPLRDRHPEGADVTVTELLGLAVEESDGSASDVLLRLVHGPGSVMDFLRSAGVRGMNVRDPERRLAEDWSAQYANSATPDSAVAVLRALDESRGLASSSRELLLRFMTATSTFPGRIKGLLPAGTVVAHKTGSSGQRDGVWAATNDIGLVTLPDGRRMAVAVFVSDSKADENTRDAVIAKIARAAWDEAVKSR